MDVSTYLYIALSVLFNALAQIALKIAAENIKVIDFKILTVLQKIQALLTVPIIIGLICYVISIVTWVIALSKVDVSTAYPMLSMGYVVVILLAWLYLGENISLIKVVAMSIIIVGVILISKS